MPGVTKAPNPRLEAVYDIIIDESGHFKYVLCKVHDPVDPHEFKYIVRGSVTADFHSDIYDDLDIQLDEIGLVCECLGGGKIYHDPVDLTLEISGESEGYGRANHSITADILRERYPEYTITWT